MLNLSRHPLVRSAAVLAAVALGFGLVLAAGADYQRIDDTVREPYPPFRMTYTSRSFPDGTVELTWLGRDSWQTMIVSSGGAGSRVGSRARFDGATYVSFDPLLGIRVEYLSCDRDGRVPGPWFVPYAFTAEEGWEALGRGPDGYDHFLWLEREGETEHRTLYKRDPLSGLVMEVMYSDGDALVTAFRVISLDILPESYASAGACADVEILHLQPPPEPQPTQAAE